MEHVGLVAGAGMGVIVSLSAPALVWAVVVAGLRRVFEENVAAGRRSRIRSSKAGA